MHVGFKYYLRAFNKIFTVSYRIIFNYKKGPRGIHICPNRIVIGKFAFPFNLTWLSFELHIAASLNWNHVAFIPTIVFYVTVLLIVSDLLIVYFDFIKCFKRRFLFSCLIHHAFFFTRFWSISIGKSVLLAIDWWRVRDSRLTLGT